jgi:hypothetical protein
VPAWAFAKAEQEGPPGLFQSSDQAAVYHQARPIDPLDLQAAELGETSAASRGDA